MDAIVYIIPTPIGNLKDITLRAIEVLKEIDVLLAEDTRVSQRLLSQLGISCPVYSFHKFNEHQVLTKLTGLLQEGKKLGLISDAGTPGISDPAFLLVRECIKLNIKVECLPGPTAFVPALVASGLPCERFCFEGFLPVKKGRHTRLTELAQERRTMIFYESPHRLIKTLENLAEYFGAGRKACVARELTKMYEEIQRDTLNGLITYYKTHTLKGEIVIVVQGIDN